MSGTALHVPNSFVSRAFEAELDEAERKAIDALARYKFQMFGYWAAIWVHLNRISGLNRTSPFKLLVLAARGLRPTAKDQQPTTHNGGAA